MTLAQLLRLGPAPVVEAPAARRRGWTGQLARFGVVGGATSLLQLALYAFLADSIGAQAANVASWLVSTLVATEAHRRFSFGGSASNAEGDHAVGLGTSVLTLLLSTVALAALDNPTGAAGVAALIAVNAGVGLLRFGTLRWWMIGRPAHSQATPSPSRSSLLE